MRDNDLTRERPSWMRLSAALEQTCRGEFGVIDTGLRIGILNPGNIKTTGRQGGKFLMTLTAGNSIRSKSRVSRRRTSAWVGLIAGVAILPVTTACGSDEGGNPTKTDTSTTTTVTTSTTSLSPVTTSPGAAPGEATGGGGPSEGGGSVPGGPTGSGGPGGGGGSIPGGPTGSGGPGGGGGCVPGVGCVSVP